MRRALLVCAAVTFALACTDNITEPVPERTAAVAPPVSFATTTTEDGLSISTDKDDYQPGDTVHLTGSGWPADDVLDIKLDDEPATHDPHIWTIPVGADGTFHDSTYVVDVGDLGVTFTLVATSRATGRSLTVTFTDNIPPGSITVTLDNVAAVSVSPGATISLAVTARVTSQGNNVPLSWKSTGWVLLPNPATTEPAGKLANCVDTPNVTGTSGNGTEATATFNITAPANPGTYDLWVALSDADGTGTTACGGTGGLSQKKVFPSSVTVQVVDQTAPTVTIDQAAGQADPTNASPINFTVVFSETVTDFATGDVTLSGTANATTAVVTGSGTTYNVAVSGMTSDGTVIASIAADVAHDAAGNGNVASTSTDNEVAYDATPPTVTINQAAGQADPTNTSPINFTVVFSEPVSDFATGDVTLSGTAGATTATVTGSGMTYNVAVSGMTGDGTVIASIGAGVASDAAGNLNLASTSTDNTVTYDTTPPAISNFTVNPNPVAVNTDFTISATFTDALSNVTGAEYSLGGTGGTWVALPNAGGSYDSQTETGSITLNLPNAAVLDVCVRSTDQATNRNETSGTNPIQCILLAVYDPSAGFVTGGGWINSPPGAYPMEPSLIGKATFGFVSRYVTQGKDKTPELTGNTEFQFHAGNLNFKSTSYEWLVVNGGSGRAQYKGEGRVNGAGSYGFILTALDGSSDKLRIKIWDTSTNVIVYDNQMGKDDTGNDATELSGGTIIIHVPKK